MRLEIIIPDSTRPELKARLTRLTERLSARPELAEEFAFEEDDFQAMFTPDRLAHIDEALADVAAGRFHTAAQVEEIFARKEATWQSQHP